MIEFKKLRDGDIVKVGKQRYIIVETKVDEYGRYALNCMYSMKLPKNVIASMFLPRTFIGFNVKDIRKWQYLNLYENTASLAKEQMTEEERNVMLVKIMMLHRDKINKDLDYIVYDNKKTYEMNVNYNNRNRMYALTMLNGFYSLCFMPKYPLIITDKECFVPPNEMKENKTVIDIRRNNQTAVTLRYIKDYGIVSKEYIREYDESRRTILQ